jgi:hypothetical protein
MPMFSMSTSRELARVVVASSSEAARGYPIQGGANESSKIGGLAWLLVFLLAGAALHGPQAAALVELFPANVRYTALSVPYNIGTGWVGAHRDHRHDLAFSRNQRTITRGAGLPCVVLS